MIDEDRGLMILSDFLISSLPISLIPVVNGKSFCLKSVDSRVESRQQLGECCAEPSIQRRLDHFDPLLIRMSADNSCWPTSGLVPLGPIALPANRENWQSTGIVSEVRQSASEHNRVELVFLGGIRGIKDEGGRMKDEGRANLRFNGDSLLRKFGVFVTERWGGRFHPSVFILHPSSFRLAFRLALSLRSACRSSVSRTRAAQQRIADHGHCKTCKQVAPICR